MALFLPTGPLVSFHAEADDPASQLHFLTGRGTNPEMAVGWATAYVPQTQSAFEQDTLGVSRAPLKPTLYKVQYLLKGATRGDMETQWRALLFALDADYTVGGQGPYSGQKGWLRVQSDADGQVYRAWARIEDAPAVMTTANVRHMIVPLSWTILEGPPPEKAQGFVPDT